MLWNLQSTSADWWLALIKISHNGQSVIPSNFISSSLPFSFPFLGFWFLSVFHLPFFPHDQPISTFSSPVGSNGNCWHILGKIEKQWGGPPRLSCRRENTDLEGIVLSKYMSTCQFASLISVWWQKCELKGATMSYDFVIIKQQDHWEIVFFSCMT